MNISKHAIQRAYERYNVAENDAEEWLLQQFAKSDKKIVTDDEIIWVNSKNGTAIVTALDEELIMTVYTMTAKQLEESDGIAVHHELLSEFFDSRKKTNDTINELLEQFHNDYTSKIHALNETLLEYFYRTVPETMHNLAELEKSVQHAEIAADKINAQKKWGVLAKRFTSEYERNVALHDDIRHIAKLIDVELMTYDEYTNFNRDELFNKYKESAVSKYARKQD